MHILNGKLERGDVNKNANGGTELMAQRIASLDNDLLKHFQIIFSRVQHELDHTKIPLYYCHDLPGDPASEHLKQGGYTKFHKVLFVSNWQMQNYINYYGVPWYRSRVLQNAIDPISLEPKSEEKIKIIYHTTPHRGLEILIPVFMQLAEKYKNIELDVFSSFKIYGWQERDQPYQQLFEMCKNHPQINYHGFQSNDVVREALQKAHIFAYPSIWLETSCIALIEAMSAGCLCIHPNYGALYETAANCTWMYQYREDAREHMYVMYSMLEKGINEIFSDNVKQTVLSGKYYIDSFYSWERRSKEWESFLRLMLDEKRIKV